MPTNKRRELLQAAAALAATGVATQTSAAADTAMTTRAAGPSQGANSSPTRGPRA